MPGLEGSAGRHPPNMRSPRSWFESGWYFVTRPSARGFFFQVLWNGVLLWWLCNAANRYAVGSRELHALLDGFFGTCEECSLSFVIHLACSVWYVCNYSISAHSHFMCPRGFFIGQETQLTCLIDTNGGVSLILWSDCQLVLSPLIYPVQPPSPYHMLRFRCSPKHFGRMASMGQHGMGANEALVLRALGSTTTGLADWGREYNPF